MLFLFIYYLWFHWSMLINPKSARFLIILCIQSFLIPMFANSVSKYSDDVLLKTWNVSYQLYIMHNATLTASNTLLFPIATRYASAYIVIAISISVPNGNRQLSIRHSRFVMILRCSLYDSKILFLVGFMQLWSYKIFFISFELSTCMYCMFR